MLRLHGWALDGAIGTENAAVTGFRFKDRVTRFALMEEQAGVGGHLLFGLGSTVWARDG